MRTSAPVIHVADFDVEVVRKDIKNLHLAVYPPEGRVRVATPNRLDDDAVRLAVVSKLGWIRRQQERLRKQVRQSQREMVNGESHYAWGRRYRLKVIEDSKANRLALSGNKTMVLHARPNTGRDRRFNRLKKCLRNSPFRSLILRVERWIRNEIYRRERH